MTERRGICPYCHRDVSLVDGVMLIHGEHEPPNGEPPMCPASGMTVERAAEIMDDAVHAALSEARARIVGAEPERDDIQDAIDEAGYDGPVPEKGSPEYERLSEAHPARILADMYARQCPKCLRPLDDHSDGGDCPVPDAERS